MEIEMADRRDENMGYFHRYMASKRNTITKILSSQGNNLPSEDEIEPKFIRFYKEYLTKLVEDKSFLYWLFGAPFPST